MAQQIRILPASGKTLVNCRVASIYRIIVFHFVFPRTQS